MAYPIAFEDVINAATRDLDVVVAGQISEDTNGSKIIGLAQMQDFFDDLRRRPVDWFLGIDFLLISPSTPPFSYSTFQR